MLNKQNLKFNSALCIRKNNEFNIINENKKITSIIEIQKIFEVFKKFWKNRNSIDELL